MSANDARMLTHRVRDHRKTVAEKMLSNIYKSISLRARYGDKVLTYNMPVVTDTVYDSESVFVILKDTLTVRNFKVVRVGHALLISWGT